MNWFAHYRNGHLATPLGDEPYWIEQGLAKLSAWTAHDEAYENAKRIAERG